jgi:NAD(P)-dependent dehydrogenase (short-subunit alcohol dehydrogenase family)
VKRAPFEDRRVLITGAASGIGRATAIELARQGAARIALSDVDRRGLDESASLVRAEGAAAIELVADLSCEDAVDRLATEALTALGEIDVLISNAGVAVAGPLIATSDADWAWVFGVNVWAPIRLTRAIVPHMAARGRGHVVITASMAGLVGAPSMSAYSTTKFALVGFAEALRLEVADAGIDVTVICPGYVRTNLHRATRYRNDRFQRFLDAPPSWYGLTTDKAARIIARGIARKQPLVVFGIEKVGWWLKRAWPSLAFELTRRAARRAGIL